MRSDVQNQGAPKSKPLLALLAKAWGYAHIDHCMASILRIWSLEFQVWVSLYFYTSISKHAGMKSKKRTQSAFIHFAIKFEVSVKFEEGASYLFSGPSRQLLIAEVNTGSQKALPIFFEDAHPL